MEANAPSRIEISVPADPDHFEILRLVVRSAGARLGASVDQIDDAALAVQEAAITLIDAAITGPITMVLVPGDGELAARLWANTTAPVEHDSMATRIIEALTADLEITSADDTSEIRMLLKTGG